MADALKYSEDGFQEMQEHCSALFSEMKHERAYMEPMWKEITKFVLPEYEGWDFQVDADIVAGEHIFDGEAIAAHARLADGIFGWLVSPTIPWLSFVPKDKADEDDMPFMQYLRDLEMYLYDVFNRSNFYDAIHQDLHIGCGIGTSVMTIDNSDDLGRPVYEPLHPREIYIAENRYHDVDVLARRYQVTNRQLIQEFGQMYDGQKRKEMMQVPEKRVFLRHMVFPNKDFVNDGGIKMGSSKRFLSVHINEDGLMPQGAKTNVLKVSGMDERKFEAWRFSHASGQVYGTSPLMKAIYDIKMINMMSKTMMDSDQLDARPPLQTSELMKGKLRILPGGVTYGMDPVTPVLGPRSSQRNMDAMMRRAQIIREHLKTDFFQSISQLQAGSRERTSNEIDQVKAESAAVMGSVVGRIQSERLEPLVRMTMMIERDAKRLPPVPEGVDMDKVFDLRFTGPLAQSQRKYLRVQGITSGLGAAMQLAQAAPDSLMNFDLNWAARELAVANGYPHAGLLSLDDTRKMQQQAQQQRAQMAQMQMQNERMAAMGRGNRSPEPGSPTEAAMGGPGRQG
jgi:hypothetical protein